MGLISGSGRSPGRGNGNPLQYSCWENSMDRGAWWTAVHGVTNSRKWLSLHSCIFTNWRFETTLHSASLEAPFFQLHWLNSCLHVTFWNSHNISDFFIIIIFVMVICNQWSFLLLLSLFWGTTNHAHMIQNLIDKCVICVLVDPPVGCSTISPPLPSGLPIPWDTMLKLGQ